MDMTSFENWLERPAVGHPGNIRRQMQVVLHAIALVRSYAVKFPRNTLELRRLIEARGMGTVYTEALTNLEIYHYPYTQGTKA